MIKTKIFVHGLALAFGGCMVLTGAALAQTTTASRPALTYTPPSQAPLAHPPAPGAQPVPGNPAASDIVSANDALVKAITARNKGDRQTACTHATNAAKALALTASTDRAHSAKMYSDLKALACAAKPK